MGRLGDVRHEKCRSLNGVGGGEVNWVMGLHVNSSNPQLSCVRCIPNFTMLAHSQPIALPPTSNTNNHDYAMVDVGSYTGSSSGTFNPASFTRHFLGSPISWRTGSYGMTSRIPAGSPTAQFLSSIECALLVLSSSSSC